MERLAMPNPPWRRRWPCSLVSSATTLSSRTGLFIKLRKLQHIRARGTRGFGFESYESMEEELVKGCPKILVNRFCLCTMGCLGCSLACCNHNVHKFVLGLAGDSNRCDLCTWCCHAWLPFLARIVDPGGVVLPRGLMKMKALHTLGVVNIARGKPILQEIRCLTQLRKLAVIGINKKNCQEFCCILSDLSSLESLSVKSVVDAGLHGCLDAVSSPPKSLQSLKLHGMLVKLPEWIGGLQNLVKLKLQETNLSEVDGTIHLLGKLPNLAILCLLDNSFNGEGIRLTFCREAPFPSLIVLAMYHVCGLDSVEYEQGVMPKLELLLFRDASSTKARLFSGLESLPKLKEFQQDDLSYPFQADVEAQLANNPNRPVLKRCLRIVPL